MQTPSGIKLVVIVMIDKLRQNIPLILGTITLLGAIGQGINELGRVVDTLSGIDYRMADLEYRFEELRNETQVSNDIAILYEKIYQLESAKFDNEYLSERVTILENRVDELGNDLGQFTNLSERITYIEANMYNQTENKNEIELWEFQNLKDRVLILETEYGDLYDVDWRLDELENAVFDW